MATPKDTTSEVISAVEVKELLVWVRGEIKIEMQETGGTLRLLEIDGKIRRLLRKYNMI